MKKLFKKFFAVMLAAFIFVPGVSLSYADSVTDKYVANLQKIYEWKGVDSVSNLKCGFSTTGVTHLDDMSLLLNIKVDGNSSLKPVSSKINMDIDINASGALKNMLGSSIKLSDIKIYTDENSNIYINKDAVNTFLKLSGSTQQIKEDYVKLTMPEESAALMPVLKSNPQKIFNAVAEFLKNTEFLSAFNINEQNGVYSANMNASQIVDMIDYFIKYTLNNFNVFLDFYKAIGIDYIANINKTYAAVGMPAITEQQMIDQLKSQYNSYVEASAQYLPLIKDVLKGSSLTFKKDFSSANYYSEYSKLNLNINFNELQKSELGKNISPAAAGNISIVIETSGSSIRNDYQDISMPYKAKEVNLDELMASETKVTETQNIQDAQEQPVENTAETK